jgi:hypothetical protein
MFAEKFSPLIISHPQDADSLRRVADYFFKFEERQGARLFDVRLTPHRLFDISQAGSSDRLARILNILIEARIFERRIIVRSPLGGGIEYRSYAELPDFVRDPLRDVDMEVTAENIEASYILVADEIH